MSLILPKVACRYESLSFLRPGLRAGAVLGAVRYAEPAGCAWPRDGYRHDQVHEVSLGVELVWATGANMIVSWAMEGEIEGISADLSPCNSESSDERVSWSDVSAVPQWRSLLGLVVTNVAIASYMPTGKPPETLWAVRLGLKGAGSVVIALGEADGDDLAYHPHGLVIVFDESVARCYQIPGSSTSAWGNTLSMS
jgi:hypothetical protein